jgi:hypothetical protein
MAEARSRRRRRAPAKCSYRKARHHCRCIVWRACHDRLLTVLVDSSVMQNKGLNRYLLISVLSRRLRLSRPGFATGLGLEDSKGKAAAIWLGLPYLVAGGFMLPVIYAVEECTDCAIVASEPVAAAVGSTVFFNTSSCSPRDCSISLANS